MSEMEVVTTTESECGVTCVGICKWFNNKAGYGFITVVDRESKVEQDIFVHHSALKVSEEQYKYLIQGEYVEFKMKKTEGGEHAVQADEVSGINNGKLMCETRKDVRGFRQDMRSSMNDDVDTNDKEWTEVKNNYHKNMGKGGRGRGKGGKGKGSRGS